MNGMIHWGRKTCTGVNQTAYYDIYVYEVPFTGKPDKSLMRRALNSGKYDKRPKPWTGACGSAEVVSVDENRMVATIEIGLPIGD